MSNTLLSFLVLFWIMVMASSLLVAAFSGHLWIGLFPWPGLFNPRCIVLREGSTRFWIHVLRKLVLLMLAVSVFWIAGFARFSWSS